MPLFAKMHDAGLIRLLGVLIFVLGGLAGAVFYLPFKKVKDWAWESYWFIYAVFGLIIVPWALAYCTSPNVVSVLTACAGQGARLLLPVRGNVGLRRADLGIDDSLSRRRPGAGHRRRLVFGGGHAPAAHPQTRLGAVLRRRGRQYRLVRGDSERTSHALRHAFDERCALGRAGFACRHRAGRRSRHEQGERIARGRKEKGRRRVQFQEGNARGDLFRA